MADVLLFSWGHIVIPIPKLLCKNVSNNQKKKMEIFQSKKGNFSQILDKHYA